jgi:hypothetical protein
MNRMKKCFIIAPLDVNLEEIKFLLLNKYNVKSYDAADIDIFTNVINELRNKILESDFVLAVLFGERLPNIYFELGLAIGNDKPIFLITDDHYKIPNLLSDITYVYTDYLNIEKIDFVFSVFYKKSIKERKKPPIYRKTLENIDLPENMIGQIKGFEFELKVKKILELDSSLTIIQQHVADPFDFAIWSDNFVNYFSNPIIVEIKSNPKKHILIRTFEKMQKYLIRRNLDLGIIIYEGKKLEFHEKSIFPFIFVFHISEIEIQLDKRKPFSRLIVDKRNNQIHRGY